MKKEEKKPSEVLEELLELLKESQKEYQSCMSGVYQYDKKPQDYLHDMEFTSNCKERSKISTQMHRDRIERRRLKDRAQLVQNIAAFYSDKSNKQFFDKLKSLISKQKEIEKFLEGERHYKRRGGDVNAIT